MNRAFSASLYFKVFTDFIQQLLRTGFLQKLPCEV